METEKRDFELSFEDVLLLKLGLHELRRTYEAYVYLDSKEQIMKIDELDHVLCFYSGGVL